MLLHLMKLSNLLQKHEESQCPQGISNILGDGYLMQQNRIFRQVREKTLAMGFRYSDRADSDYLAFPMGQLETILSEKVIPYVNNVDSLIKLNQKTRSSLNWDHVVDNLRPNYVFHESCHTIARSISPQSSDFKERLTIILIEESFANTCEFFAIAEAQDLIHRTFLEMNSYFTVFEDRTHLKKMIESHSATSIFKFMFLCYLHSNFLNERIDDNDLKAILALTAFNKNVEIKTLRSLAENVFALNPRFRYATTEMYLRLNGFNQSVQNALDFEYLSLLNNNKSMIEFINQLSHFAGAQT